MLWLEIALSGAILICFYIGCRLSYKTGWNHAITEVLQHLLDMYDERSAEDV